MAVNFPDNPTVNDEFTSGNRTWIWDNSVWLLKANTFSLSDLDDISLISLSDGEAILYNSVTGQWENGAVDALPPQSGNAGYFLTTDGSSASWAMIETGSSSTTVSESPPLEPEEGDTWFRSSTGQYFVYYDSYWVEIGAGSTPDLSAYYTNAETDSAIATALSEYYTSSETNLAISSAIISKKTELNLSIASDLTMVAGSRYFVDTSVARNLTLPVTPAVGDEIQIFDSTGTGSTNNVTILNNSEKINGVLDSAIIDIDGFATVFVYTGTTYGWRMI